MVVTLDPWRDTPARLHHLATHWDVAEDGFLLSGEVDAVNRVLDDWNVARQRDLQTGDVTHPPLVYVSVSGFGSLLPTPYGAWPAYALVAEAKSS